MVEDLGKIPPAWEEYQTLKERDMRSRYNSGDEAQRFSPAVRVSEEESLPVDADVAPPPYLQVQEQRRSQARSSLLHNSPMWEALRE